MKAISTDSTPSLQGKRYWEVVILVRRILFALVISVVPYTSPAILYLSLVVVIQVSIWLQQKHTPFKFETENRMELGSLYVIFTSFFLAMVHSFIPDQEWISPTIIVLNVVTVAIFLLLATVPALSQYVETLASDNPRNYQAEMTPIDLTSREMKDNDGEVDAESRPVAMDLQLE